MSEWDLLRCIGLALRCPVTGSLALEADPDFSRGLGKGDGWETIVRPSRGAADN
ncbi:MAG: hypothetical protein AB1603_01560 [Chloroflexota bacterium]